MPLKHSNFLLLLLLMGFYIEDQVHKELYTLVYKEKNVYYPCVVQDPDSGK